MSPDALEDLERNPAVVRALEWYETQPEPRDPMALIRHVEIELSQLCLRAHRELGRWLTADELDDLTDALDPRRAIVDPPPFQFDPTPKYLPAGTKDSWQIIANERRVLVEAINGLRAEVAHLATAHALENPEAPA
jgi:hypothetical protein